MLIPIIEIWVAGILLIASFIDIRHKEIPSFFLTSGIFVLLLFQIGFGNINNAILFSILSAIVGVMFIEMDYMRGIADLKGIVLVGSSLFSINDFAIFILSFLFLGIFYKFIWTLKIKDNEIPFLPVIFFSYLLTLILGALL